MRLTKEHRQQIVRDFAIRHNGHFNPNLFLEEVRKVGESHPAWSWFEWDRDKAALAYQVEQARDFARDLRVTFTVEEVGTTKAVKVRETAMPFVLSPIEGRKDGGGYYLTDPSDPAHMVEHCRQAAIALRAWLNRYQAALLHAGGSSAVIEEALRCLEAQAPDDKKAA